MYKIYINDIPFILSSDLALARNIPGDKTNIVARYNGSPKIFLNYSDMLEKGRQLDSITIFSENLEGLWADFCSNFKIIEAAGGCVFNAQEQLLVIYRRGSWDLPKGKIDPGETPEQAAVREVEEETGIAEISLGNFLDYTYHTYRDPKERRILKRTYWYRMHTPQSNLIPQAEEDIEVAEWVFPGPFLAQPGLAIYRSIKEVIEKLK
ncbi:MAG: NUDIX domain-containing protein [Haliscomenobacter sp.]|uniref:NUDIX hydrolase n=1 Tax=Haliscomenobacter sp. TaxID=2717303 RepID=UPI0029A902D8|nr:NUDIX domain-containing protein [Haliscomenobacter sp.]MDX2068894.1 NUDIX domain-containing protein [Haliscomenobacter sp.]